MIPARESTLRCPLDAILGSVLNVRILREIARRDGEVSMPILVSAVGGSRKGTFSALSALLKVGIVLRVGSRIGLYRLNRSHMFAPFLMDMFEEEEGRYRAVFKAVEKAADDASIDALWVYGSVSRAEDRDGSDFDIAVVSSSGGDSDIEAVSEFVSKSLEKPSGDFDFSPSVIVISHDDVLRLSESGDPWWLGMAADAIAVKGRKPEKLAEKLGERKRSHGQSRRDEAGAELGR